mmetsp:Transcript_12399/g.18176  ORF Transcript_12399/g.18176 Transcript_12399/m.18176 type:complete len:181 (-) Transcript_12399:44-586(-)
MTLTLPFNLNDDSTHSTKWHPDKNRGDENATQTFQKISAAYAHLASNFPQREKHNETYNQTKGGTFKVGAKNGKFMTTEEVEDLYRQVFAARPANTGVRFERNVHGGFTYKSKSRQPNRSGPIPKGKVIVLQHIGNIPRLNGQHAIVISYIPSDDRYLVRLLSTGERVEVCPGNMAVLGR